MSTFDTLTVAELAKYIERYTAILTFNEGMFHGAFVHEMFGVYLQFPTWEVAISDSETVTAPTLGELLEEMDQIHPIKV